MTPLTPYARPIAWACCLISSLLVSMVNALVWRGTGLNLFSFSYLVFLPVGAILMGFCAMSGFYVAANHFKFPARRIDFAFLLLVAVAFALQIFLGIYLSFYFMGKVVHPSPASFMEFISLYVTRVKHAMRFNSHTQDVVAAGEAGWYLLMIQLMALCAVARTIYGATNRSGNAQWESKF